LAGRLRANVEQLRGNRKSCASVSSVVAGGHVLIEDVPGVGKTTLAHALARSVDTSFRRIQFTSDLLPADLVGAPVPEMRDGRATGAFAFQPAAPCSHRWCSPTRSTAPARRRNRRCSKRWPRAR
jgi:hypothetical protein